MIEIDFVKHNVMMLDDPAFEVAAEMATAAHVAGFEPVVQLDHAIKAYILGLEAQGFLIVAPDHIMVPTTLTQAEGMFRLGYAYIRQNDPMREI